MPDPDKPIPVKFTKAEAAGIDALQKRAKTGASDIIRRLVDFGLEVVQSTGRIDFLFDDEVAGRIRRRTVEAANAATLSMASRPKSPEHAAAAENLRRIEAAVPNPKGKPAAKTRLH